MSVCGLQEISFWNSLYFCYLSIYPCISQTNLLHSRCIHWNIYLRSVFFLSRYVRTLLLFHTHYYQNTLMHYRCGMKAETRRCLFPFGFCFYTFLCFVLFFFTRKYIYQQPHESLHMHATVIPANTSNYNIFFSSSSSCCCI